MMLDFISKYKTELLTAGLVILIMLNISQCNKLKNAESILNQNITAMTDSLSIVINKNKELSYQKAAYVATVDQLKQMSDSLYQALRAEKGTPHYIVIQSGTTSSTPAQPISNTINWSDSTVRFTFSDSTELSTIKGFTSFSVDTNAQRLAFRNVLTTITQNSHKFKIATGVLTENGIVRIFVTPKTPNVSIDAIEGAILTDSQIKMISASERNKRITIGPFVGVGLSSEFSIIPVYGVGIGYSLFKF